MNLKKAYTSFPNYIPESPTRYNLYNCRQYMDTILTRGHARRAGFWFGRGVGVVGARFWGDGHSPNFCSKHVTLTPPMLQNRNKFT